MKKGKDYELLIENLFRQLEPNADITQDDYILGKNSGTKRQIDVSIRFQNMGLTFFTIVQAKDLSRPADIKIVDEFKSVIEDVSANKGILVCSKGFTKNAKVYAEKCGIELLSIHEASKKNWQALVYFKVRKTIHKIRLTADLRVEWFNNTGKTLETIPDNPPIFSKNMVDIFSIQELFQTEVLDKGKIGELIKSKRFDVDLNRLGIFVFIFERFLKPKTGRITFHYDRVELKKFLVQPDNYIYQVDHRTGIDKLHNLVLSPKKFDTIIDPEFKTEESFNDNDAHLDIILFEFVKLCYIGWISNSVMFNIVGEQLGDNHPTVVRQKRIETIKNRSIGE